MSVVVIKLGGKLLSQGEEFNYVIEDIVDIINNSNKNVVLVHGGGPQINEMLIALGKEPRIVKSVSGMESRITDKETVDVAQMVMVGKLNKLLVSMFEKLNIKAVGLSGIDGSIIKAKRKDKLKIIDEKTGKKMVFRGDYSGRIESVDPTLINLLLEKGYLPIIAPIGIGHEFEPLNLDGDRTAGHIAAALKADSLLLFTDVKGVYINNEIVKEIGKEEINTILDKVSGGMRKKIYAAKEALELGINTVYIGSGMIEKPISTVLNGKSGTAISWKFV
ncbi:MAG: [LysW]-aminoadipate kinase [Candidatus Helarchaeota archaeon]